MYELDHVGVYAKDPVTLCKWYQEKLGLEVVRDLIDIHDRPFYFLKSKNSTFTLEILATADAPKERELQNPGFSHLCFEVEDFDKAVADLQSKGISVHGARTTKYNWKIGYFEDPEGNVVEICKR